MAWSSKGLRKYYRKGRKAFKGYLGSNNALTVAKHAMYGIKALREIVNSEKNMLDSNQPGVTVDYNGAVASVSALSQGDGIGARHGNSVLAKSLHLRLSIEGAATPHTQFRMMMFMDTMGLGTIPSPGDVLASIGSSYSTTTNLTIINAYQFRFKILLDKVITLSENGKNIANRNFYVKLNNHIKWTGTAGTDEGRNQLYVLYISNRVTTLLPTLQYNCRLQYYDN